MDIREKIQTRRKINDENFTRALIRAGLIIISGYLIGTLIAIFILRGAL